MDYKATFRMERKMWEDFKEICKERGFVASAILRVFVMRVVSCPDVMDKVLFSGAGKVEEEEKD